MKKTALLILTLLYAITCIFLSESIHANKRTDPAKTFAGQIKVKGFDPMGSPFTNGQTNVSEPDGTLFMNTAAGETNLSTFTIENMSLMDILNISSITITGANASDFEIEGTSPTMVAPGASEELNIKFTPQTVGTKNATVTITSDDATNGTFTFAIQGTAYEQGSGLHFDGVNDNITFNSGNYNINGGNFTLEFWIKPEISGTNEHFIFDNMSGSSGYNLRIDTSLQLNFTFFTSSGPKTFMTPPIVNNQWQHVAIIYNGSNYQIFIDGTLENTLTLSEALIDNSNNLTIGSAIGGVQYYAGAIDDFRVWDMDLSSCRISNQFKCQLTGSEDNLIAYYTFNNGVENGNNFPMFSTLDPKHTISSGIPPQGTLNNFGLTGTSSNWIDASSNGLTGTCSTYTEPIIKISSNNKDINNGDTDVVVTNNTSFGNVQLGQAEPADYTINNSGSASLNISNITINGSTDFSIIESPTTIAAGASGNLRILFTPSANAHRTATVEISNNDCDNGTFTFAIEGTGYTPATGLDFDGTDDHISISHNSSFNTNTFTVEGYFKTSSTTDNNPIISKYDATNENGFSIQLSDTGRLRFYYKSSNITTTVNSSISGLNDGNWHRFSIVFGDNTVQFYVDGTANSSNSYATTPNAPTNTESTFIGYSSYSNQYFSGELDEIRFWSRALCSDELSAQETCELTGNESGLVAYYKLNEGNVNANNSSKSTANDETSNNLDGTLTNFSLTGPSSNWVDTTANNISGNCSVAIPEINVQGNGNDILTGDTTPISGDNTDADSVNVGSSKEMSFFIRNSDGSASLNVSGIVLTGDTSDFSITRNPSNNPIPATESASLIITFTPTSGGIKTATVVISSDDCDEPTYSFTIQGTGIPPGTGLDFDGSDDLVTISHNTSQNNLNFSVDFWIKTTDGLGGVINKFTPNGNNGWRVNLDGGRIEFYYYASTSNYVTRLLSPATKVDDDEWHHVAITLDSGNARCYIDGTLARSTGWVGTPTVTSTTANIQLGYTAADSPSGDTGGYFDGQLDELRIWTKTLSAFEVGQLNGCTADMSQNNLIASYNFNSGISGADNSGLTTLTDSSSNNFNGTLSNFALSGVTSNWIDASANNVSNSCDCIVIGDVTLTSQTEVDTFTATLGDCGIIEGDVTINGTITDLSGFSKIHTISGNLHLEGNISNDLSGFSNLTTIGGNITFKDMSNITSIVSFSNITSLGGSFEVNNLDQLTDISILNQLTSISSIAITNNSILSTIAFDEIQTISSNFSITFNSSLSSISIPKLTQVSGEFRMNNNVGGMTNLNLALLESTGNFLIADMHSLQSITAPELQTVTGRLAIGSCSGLTTLSISKLTSISNNASIDHCQQLTTITTPALSTIGGNFSLDNLGITNLSFLQNLTSISGQLLLRDLVSLNNLQGLDELTTLGSFNLSNCDLVSSLEGFPKLTITSINTLSISENELITTFDNSFLASLTSIGILGISFNGNLADISALQNVTELTSTDSTIRNNNALLTIDLFGLQNVTNTLVIQNQENTTSLCGLFNYIHNGNGSSTLSFVGTHPTAWDSVQDITDSCSTPVITLTGDNPQNIALGSGYTELGASVNDGSNVTIDASAFVDAIGSYSITYNATGVSGNAAVEVIRTVNVVHPSQVTWNGSVNTSWTTNGNWSTNLEPLTTQSVIVPNVTNTPEVTSAIQINDLTVESLSSFDINANGGIMVDGNFVNNGTFAMVSTASNSASLVVKGTSNGQVTYARGGLLANQWSIVAAPVSGQSVKDFVEDSSNAIRVNTTVTPNRYAVGYYDDSRSAGDKWVYYTVDDLASNSITFQKGQSYAISRASNGSISFTGSLETTDVNKSVVVSEWNAIGNPYTAFLPINENSGTNFINDNLASFDPTYVGVYVWDNTQSKYIPKTLVSGESSLAPGQGFFVKTTNSASSMAFKQAQRMVQPATGGTFGKGSNIPTIKLSIASKGVQVNTTISYRNNATKGLDAGYDLGNFDGAGLDIYTRLLDGSSGKNFTYQSLPSESKESFIIPIGVKVKEGTSITISGKGISLPRGIEMYLEDRELGKFINLNKEEYSLTIAKTTNGIGRFYLHTKAQVETLETTLADIMLYNLNSKLFVKGISGDSFKLTIFNTLGAVVYTNHFNGTGNNIIDLPSVETGLYVISLETNIGIKTKKVILKK
ncbi:choice-of-anchor D domain-containing protein [Tenacibaculum sp. S7007]|uniref:Choice-of-anchor D domain-containing protein n=1 Tax=Tenacibaculum pelagium TaxID=2759527 RepID=A0A839AK95_9FLAO|nr:LamG-like jellyroll fold domain-containing protein [Tenacibaculum pelagium]MBA6154917.1 choice-of-anchor D domain-containing protein [Tenacibaculum pelagium]